MFATKPGFDASKVPIARIARAPISLQKWIEIDLSFEIRRYSRLKERSPNDRELQQHER
jgi:hypothetical protein